MSQAFRVTDAIPLPEPGDLVTGRARREDAYPIVVCRSFEATIAQLVEWVDGSAVALLTDDVVEALYGPTLIRGLREAGKEPLARVIPAGEASKSLDEAVAAWHWLAESDIARRDVLLTFGGGVIADLGGWVASGYMRGIPYINVPTTLLAQVDGALGGKVAANHAAAKNLLGAFHSPAGVVANVGFLRSTSGRHLRAGLAEAIKKAVIASPAYWAFIDENADALLAGDVDALERLVHCAAAIKTALIERDPYERDLRRPLNFGHTIGHPLETVTGYGPLLHGEAVAFGMAVEARIAHNRGLLDSGTLHCLLDLLRRCALPVTASALPVSVDAEAVIGAMEKVRQIRAGSLRFVLPIALGETVIADDVAEDEVREALATCGLRVAVSGIQ
ncbi:MAG TPA: 3-dehydroquinate synthase family protein [Solirubrobacteraceae bacterium]|nr:3-dehydroquinate synthase family protein [Solirubrobacteraceae bacterium]